MRPRCCYALPPPPAPPPRPPRSHAEQCPRARAYSQPASSAAGVVVPALPPHNALFPSIP
ncbi:hypothetical protein JYU34_007847 [Plutella xylostella]|uniref:Uncharacterized protein n=1 Tax=Plutella xylostella TaxID=51655 RepID=A0ABQ7QRL4_PLUXY|nr:hypothetical protein JYU34_007847 [Plutella xylostella]